MTFHELIKIRQSVRKYRDKPVEPEKIQWLIEAVRLAPSASNSQPWKLIVVDDRELKNEVAGATFGPAVSFNRFALDAPVMAVLAVEKPGWIVQMGGRLKKRDFPMIDIGIAAAHFCLQAAELGLGTCILGWFDEKAIKKTLKIPRRTGIGLVMTLGYAQEGYPLREKTRKKAEEMCRFNGY